MKTITFNKEFDKLVNPNWDYMIGSNTECSYIAVFDHPVDDSQYDMERILFLFC